MESMPEFGLILSRNFWSKHLTLLDQFTNHYISTNSHHFLAYQDLLNRTLKRSQEHKGTEFSIKKRKKMRALKQALNLSVMISGYSSLQKTLVLSSASSSLRSSCIHTQMNASKFSIHSMNDSSYYFNNLFLNNGRHRNHPSSLLTASTTSTLENSSSRNYHTSQTRYGLFSNLTSNMSNAFSSLLKKKTLTKEDVEEAMQKVRVALLDADVAESVVTSFIKEVTEDAIGVAIVQAQEPQLSSSEAGGKIAKTISRIAKWLGPNQKAEELPKSATVYLLVMDRLSELLGGHIEPLQLNKASEQRSVIMVTGIQGSGKTTTSAKLALQLKRKENRKVLLVSLDTYRPAAQTQLETLARQIQVESLPIIAGQMPIEIAQRAMQYVGPNGEHFDTIIFDTAGRMHIDEELMKELEELRIIVTPNETLLVADSMLGNDAVNIATQFHDRVGLTGIILTRMDGTSSGGCAISMKKVVGLSVKYIGVGEKMDDLEIFDPQSLAKRILGVGDIMTLANKAKEAMNMDASQAQAKIAQYSKGAYTFKDYLEHISTMKKMGSLKNMASYLPESMIGKFRERLDSMDLSFFDAHEGIISHMSEQEKLQPLLLQSSSARRLDLAKKAKVDITEINKMLKMFEKIKSVMSKMGSTVMKDPKKVSELMMKDPTLLMDLVPQKVKKQVIRPPKR